MTNPLLKTAGFDPLPEDDLRELTTRGVRHWDSPEKRALALGLAERLSEVAPAKLRRWIVREHIDAILVHAKGPDRSGLPERTLHSPDDSPVKTGLTFRIQAPENGQRPGAYFARTSLRSDFQFAQENPLAYAQHMFDALESLRKFGLLPTGDRGGSRGLELFAVRLTDPLRQVPALVKAYLGLPDRGLGRPERRRTTPAAQGIEDAQEPRIPRR